jgi:calmodulin
MFREAFNLLDVNSDGTISRDELLGAESSLNLGGKSKRSSELDFSQFMELMIVSMRDLDVEQELIEAFKLFDRDGNCHVSVKEVRSMMERIDEVNEGREMLREFHDAVGADSNERFLEETELSFAQFAALIMGKDLGAAPSSTS